MRCAEGLLGLAMVLLLAGGTLAGVGTLGDSNGQVVAWGSNAYGQTNVPAGLSNVTAISAGGYHSLVSKSDGTVAAWGRNDFGQATVPAGLSNVKAVAAGQMHSLALKYDGTMAAWGYNDYGQATLEAGTGGIVAIAAGYYDTFILNSIGQFGGWGRNYGGQCNLPALIGVRAIAAGWAHSLALESDGTVGAWGYNAATVPAGLSNVTAISAGGYHSLALKSDSTVAAWGDNAYGQANVPAGLSGVTGIAGGGHHSLALKSDGTIAAWGDNTYDQTNVPSGVFVAIAAGYEHNLALRARTDYDGDLLVSGTGIRANLNRSVTIAGNADIQSRMYLYNNPTMTVTGLIALSGTGSILGAGDIRGALDLGTSGTLTGSGAYLKVYGPLSGSGTVADAILFGNLSPGHRAGQVTLHDVALMSGMTTFMELGGTVAGANDHIILEGLTTLDGALDVTLLGSFDPREGDTFDLFDGAMNGRFSSMSLPLLGGNLAWDTGRLYTDGTLTVVPEPATLSLLALGGLALLHRRRGSWV